jgi:hypothetical protein
LTAQPASTTAAVAPGTGGYPDALHVAYPDIARFRDAAYFGVLAEGGLSHVDPRALHGRIAAASEAGEGYKALYLARLFTDLQPDNAAGWSNRARLAAAVGFAGEAAAAQANAQSGTSAPVSGNALPGAIATKPASLHDWAAALALLADDVAAREGRPVIVSVKDDLSGIQVASQEDIQRENRGPWATAKPVRAEDVLPNLFVLSQAQPMDHKSMKGSMFALGALALAGSGYASTVGAAEAATTFAGLYGNAMARAFEVPSDYKGGKYTAVTYAEAAPKRVELTPKTSGKSEAVGTPLPLLWASGPSRSQALPAVWANGDSDKSEAIRMDRAAKTREWKKYIVPPLRYPRLQQLCAGVGRCSPHLTVLEVMLTADDLKVLAPGTDSGLPDLSAFASEYASGTQLTVVAAGDQFAGYDAAGVVYITKQRPTEWLTSAPAPASSGKK